MTQAACAGGLEIIFVQNAIYYALSLSIIPSQQHFRNERKIWENHAKYFEVRCGQQLKSESLSDHLESHSLSNAYTLNVSSHYVSHQP